MSSGEGWIKLHRQLLDCWIWTEDKKFTYGQAWIDLLLLANHGDNKKFFNGEFITIGRGQYLTSVLQLSKRWGWSQGKCSRFLDLLEKDNMLIQSRRVEGTLIIIKNYNSYQGCEKNQDRTNKEQDLIENKPINEKKCNKESNKNSISLADKKKTELEELRKNYEIIYEHYPYKKGKTRGFDNYCKWINGRKVQGVNYKLTNRQIYLAVDKYVKEKEEMGQREDFTYWKHFDTLMNKSLLDYIDFGEEQK